MTEPGGIAQLLGSEIRRRREERGMALEDLSDRCGLTPVFVQQIEDGQCDLSLSDVTALAFALECEACDLVAVYDNATADATPNLAAGEAAPSRRGRVN
jgi:transcriptional regulator with XRE-family HTH domain